MVGAVVLLADQPAHGQHSPRRCRATARSNASGRSAARLPRARAAREPGLIEPIRNEPGSAARTVRSFRRPRSAAIFGQLARRARMTTCARFARSSCSSWCRSSEPAWRSGRCSKRSGRSRGAGAAALEARPAPPKRRQRGDLRPLPVRDDALGDRVHRRISPSPLPRGRRSAGASSSHRAARPAARSLPTGKRCRAPLVHAIRCYATCALPRCSPGRIGHGQRVLSSPCSESGA